MKSKEILDKSISLSLTHIWKIVLFAFLAGSLWIGFKSLPTDIGTAKHDIIELKSDFNASKTVTESRLLNIERQIENHERRLNWQGRGSNGR